ncbi:MAG TPA: nucleoside kinase, partial [Sphaerochaeta sp.]|nr:nucleoside kinase [Sphaerochaeta sp.]
LTQLNLDDHNRISTTDNRIIRRMVRDFRTRGASAETTLNMWPSVHRGENRYIFPYQNNADAMINSALDYELGVLATYAQPLLKMVKPGSGPAYETARRLLRFLEHVNPIPDTLVPADSLLREFIGGSEFSVV